MRQHAILLQHPSAKVQFDGATPASIASAKADCYATRAAIEAETGVHIADDGSFVLPRPLNSDPLTIGAAMDLPAGDICVACQEKVELHFDSSGCLWIGCTGALNRRNGHKDGG